jgi:hypothetical protein
MNIKDIFTDEELALIDAGKYMPGRAVLDAKLDLAVAMEREACAKICDDRAFQFFSESPFFVEVHDLADAIRNRGQA